MDRKSILVAMTPEDIGDLLGRVADQIIDTHNMTTESVQKFSEIGQGLILEMMHTHDLTFAQGVVVLTIMLESMFKMGGGMPSCPVSKDHIN